MTRWLVGSSLRLAFAVVVAALAIIALGVVNVRNARVDALPEFGLPQVQVQTEALGLSAEEVEQLITVPLEDEFNGIPFVKYLRSQSVPGLSDIELTFNPGTDIYRARQLVTERVAQGPSVVNVGTPPVMVQPLSSSARVMMIGLSSTSVSPIDVSTLARWRIRPRLLAVPGVANVTIWGQRDQQLQVLVDPNRLAHNGVSLDQVINTAGDAMWTSPLTFVEASSPGADGFIDTPNQRLSLQHILPISTPQDLAKVPVEDVASGKRIALGDVATVVEDHPALKGDAVLDNGPALLLVVEKLPNANTVAVTKGVEQAMDALAPGLTGIKVQTSLFQPANFITTSLHNVGWMTLAGLLLVLAWLGFAFRSWRVVVVALITLLCAYAAAAWIEYLTGTTFNALVLAGLVVAVGILIDDLVGTVNSVVRGVETANQSQTRRAHAVLQAVLDDRRPLGFALAIILLATAPVALLGGLDAAMARPVIWSYLLAVGASTMVAVTLTPALGYVLLRRRPFRPTAQMSAPAAWTEPCVVNKPRSSRSTWVWAGVAILALMAVAVVPQLGSRSLIPDLNDRNLVIQWQAAQGTSLPEMERVTSRATADLRAIGGVGSVATNVGQSLLGDQIVDVNSAEMWLTIRPSADYQSTVAEIKDVLDNYPGMRHDLSTYPALTIKDGHTDAEEGSKALRVRLYGSDENILATQAAHIQQLMANTKGTANARVEMPTVEPAVEINVDTARAAKYGLKSGDIRRSSAVLVAGIPVGSYYQNQQIFDVAVWSTPAQRDSLTAIQNLLIDTPAGGHVPLKDVADVSIKPALTVINHDQVSRYLDITADVRGTSISAALNDINHELQRLAMPLGYHAEAFSDVQAGQDDDVRTLWYVIAALIGIFLLMQAAFRSWARASLLFFTLPLAMAGGAATALLAGRTMSAGAFIGFLALFALSVRHGVQLIRRIQELAGHPATGEVTADTGLDDVAVPAVPDPVGQATKEASFPLASAAVAIALALAPFLVRGDVAGVEFLRPMSFVIIGGLVTTVVYILLVLPGLHRRFIRRTDATPQPQATA